MTKQDEYVRSLVDEQNGLVSREIFTSEELYRQELERVFARTWLFVGHTSQIPNPNDFFVSRMGEESVILTRDHDGKVNVLLNTCRHRGMRVCRYDEGNTTVFTCPYHGWSYSADGHLVSVPGELVGVPQYATAYHGDLKKEEWGMIPVPKLHVYKGSIWACWDKDAPEWEEYMGGMQPFLDTLLEGTDGDPDGRVVFEGVQKWRVPSNWKFSAENFVADFYHGDTTHRSARLSGPYPAPQYTPRIDKKTDTEFLSVSFAHGHGAMSALPPDQWTSPDAFELADHPDPEIDAYFKQAYQERFRRKGGWGAQRNLDGAFTVFPNASFLNYSIAVWHPVGPTTTEIWRWYLVDKNAPPSVRKAWRQEKTIVWGPSGRLEKDDMENWGYATKASMGTIASRYPYNYEQGLGYAGPHETFPGSNVTHRPGIGRGLATEENMRGYYKRWAEMMAAPSWDELRRLDNGK